MVCSLILQFKVDPEYDFVKFMQVCHEKGMYVTLRIGPFIQAEWNHGYAICLLYFWNEMYDNN